MAPCTIHHISGNPFAREIYISFQISHILKTQFILFIRFIVRASYLKDEVINFFSPLRSHRKKCQIMRVNFFKSLDYLFTHSPLRQPYTFRIRPSSSSSYTSPRQRIRRLV